MSEVLSAHGGRDVGATGLCKAWAEGDNQEWEKGESGYELWIPSLSNFGYILGVFAWSWISVPQNMLENVQSTNKDVYNLGALVVTIESSLYTFVKLQNNEKW